jgi:hypothetical protein
MRNAIFVYVIVVLSLIGITSTTSAERARSQDYPWQVRNNFHHNDSCCFRTQKTISVFWNAGSDDEARLSRFKWQWGRCWACDATTGKAPDAVRIPSATAPAAPSVPAIAASTDYIGPDSNKRAALMGYAVDQLRKEGVPEASLRTAAAHLVGQADSESRLNPNQVHDGGTGYGIYGARLMRRAAMLAWLAANGYSANSAEGQIRYMAHEAMTGGYPVTRRILLDGISGRFAVNAITAEFQNPAIRTDRSGAVAVAYASYGQAADKGAYFAIGDSIAAQFIFGNLLPGSAKGSENPAQVLARINSLPRGNFRGKTVLLSSGASNTGGDLGPVQHYVPLQMTALKDAGASVILMGVGPRYRPEFNAYLQGLAAQYGASYRPLTATYDGVHLLSPRAFLNSVNSPPARQANVAPAFTCVAVGNSGAGLSEASLPTEKAATANRLSSIFKRWD